MYLLCYIYIARTFRSIPGRKMHIVDVSMYASYGHPLLASNAILCCQSQGYFSSVAHTARQCSMPKTMAVALCNTHPSDDVYTRPSAGKLLVLFGERKGWAGLGIGAAH